MHLRLPIHFAIALEVRASSDRSRSVFHAHPVRTPEPGLCGSGIHGQSLSAQSHGTKPGNHSRIGSLAEPHQGLGLSTQFYSVWGAHCLAGMLDSSDGR